jgi:hypothetical protein
LPIEPPQWKRGGRKKEKKGRTPFGVLVMPVPLA